MAPDLAQHDLKTLLYLIPKSPLAQKAVADSANFGYVVERSFPGYTMQDDEIPEDTDEPGTRPSSPVERDSPVKAIRLGLDSPLIDPGQGFVFGRGRNLQRPVDIRLDVGDPRISSSHFRIYLESARSMIMIANQSSNGIDINKERISNSPRTAFHGALLQCAGVTFEVFLPDHTPYAEVFQERVGSYMNRVFGENPNRVCQVQTKPLDRLGPYLITDEKVGEGTFGAVFRLNRTDSNLVYAAKQLKGCGELATVEHEVRLMKECRHKHVVDLIEVLAPVTAFGHNPWIIMEFIPYGTLLHHSQAYRLSRRNITDILGQMLLAVRYMHSKGITHRDIKPENILIDSMDPLFIKLSDFGLSTQKIALRTFCGTAGYAAPEIIETRLDYTNAVDIWSVAAVIWNTLRNFKDINDLQYIPLHAYYDRIETTNVTGLGRGGERLLRQMLNRNPAARPTAHSCLCDPLLQKFKEDDNETVSLLFNEWFSIFENTKVAPLKKWLRLDDETSQMKFSAPYKFYQDKLIERYGPSVYNLPRLTSHVYEMQTALSDSKRLVFDLKRMGTGEAPKNALTLLILLDRVPYHPQHLSNTLIRHFRRLACAFALFLLSRDDPDRVDYHSSYRLRPEYRCWFYLPLIFSQTDHLIAEGKRHIRAMSEEIHQSGDDAAKAFLNSLEMHYRAAVAATQLRDSFKQPSPGRKSVHFGVDDDVTGNQDATVAKFSKFVRRNKQIEQPFFT